MNKYFLALAISTIALSPCIVIADTQQVSALKHPAELGAPWGKALNGISTRLTLMSKTHTLGEPILLKLEIKNESNATVDCDIIEGTADQMLHIVGPDNKEADYIRGSSQVGDLPTTLAPQEIKVLLANFDIDKSYFISKPGKYAIQLRGIDAYDSRLPTPKSNTVTIDLRPGTPSPGNALLVKLYSAMPESWILQYLNNGPLKLKDGSSIPIVRASVADKRIGIHFVGPPSDASGFTFTLLQAKRETFDVKKTGKYLHTSGDYLGRIPTGHLYMKRFGKLAERWPEIEPRILQALEVDAS